jgi:hypothetical protein
MKKYSLAVIAAILAAGVPAHAQVRITEVVPWSSSSAVGADWFELTNTGAVALNITGWTMDDDSNNPNSALLSGVTTIAPGESVIFLELAGGGNATTLTNLFISTWFGGSAPAGLHIGTYTQGVAGGVGLGAGGDTVNIFNGTAGTLQAKVTFGASDSVNPLQTFDNAAGLNNTAISQFSVVGVNGAFVAANDINQIGSPGAIPEPQTFAMMLAGFALLGALIRKRRA